MTARSNLARWLFTVACLAGLLVVPAGGVAGAQETGGGEPPVEEPAPGPAPSDSPNEATPQPADATGTAEPDSKEAASNGEASEATAEVHPLVPILKFAKEGARHIDEKVKDYTCLLVKRELVDGELSGYEYIRAKVRHEQRDGDRVKVPFSVYLHFEGPASLEGREVLYVRGENNGDLIARRGGRRNPNLTMQLDPIGPLAMQGNRYPITEIGVKNLTERLIEVVNEDLGRDECQVRIFENAKLNDRLCTHIEVTHPTKRPHFRYHIARVFVDNEHRVPVYYGAWDWPSADGGKPVLLEEYFYTRLRLNVGLSDLDFDRTNPNYKFRNIELPSGDEQEDDDR